MQRTEIVERSAERSASNAPSTETEPTAQSPISRLHAAGGNAMVHRHGQGEPGGSPNAIFRSATSGGGGSVPHQGEMESAFGTSFAGVQAHTGKGAEMGALGAKAATDGSSIAFAEASPGKEVVAHELAHVVQHDQSGGGLQGKDGVSDPSSASEREADSVASAVVSGRPFQVKEAPDGVALHRDGTTPPSAGGGTPGSAGPAGGGPVGTANAGGTTTAPTPTGAGGAGATPLTPEQELTNAINAGDRAALERLITRQDQAMAVTDRLFDAGKFDVCTPLSTANPAVWRRAAIATSFRKGGVIGPFVSTQGGKGEAIDEAIAQRKTPQLFGSASALPSPEWAAITDDAKYQALVNGLTLPVSGATLFQQIWLFYGTASGVNEPANRNGDSARLTWRALYTARILAPGDRGAWWDGGTTTEGANQFSWRWIYEPVTPNDTTMKRFLVGVRTLPQGHVNSANIAFSAVRRKYWKRTAPTPTADWAYSNVPGTSENLGTSYYLDQSNSIVIIADAAGAMTNDTATGRTWEGTAGGVGGSQEAGAPALTYFLNHARHEVGHAVGFRSFTGVAETGDNWAKAYGGWAPSSQANFEAALWNASGTTRINLTAAGGAADQELSADVVKAWMVGLIANKAEPGGNALSAIGPGQIKNKLDAIRTSAWGAQKLTTYCTAVFYASGFNVASFQDNGYQLPGHTPPDPVQIYSSRNSPAGFWQYSKGAHDALKGSHGWYALSSWREMFAEIYTQKYSGGALPVAVNGKDPSAYFTQLEASTDSAIVPPNQAPPGAGGGGAPAPGGGPAGAAAPGAAAAQGAPAQTPSAPTTAEGSSSGNGRPLG